MGVTLDEALMEQTVLNKVKGGASLEGANMTFKGNKCRPDQCKGAFSQDWGANLTGVNFSDTDLSNADLSSADLRKAIGFGSSSLAQVESLQGANLSGSTCVRWI